MGNQIYFQYKMYNINRDLDSDLLSGGGNAQVRYKFVGFIYLLLNIGPYLV